MRRQLQLKAYLKVSLVAILLRELPLSASQGRIPNLPSNAALLPTNAATLSEFVPGSDQRLAVAPTDHVAGDGFYPADSSTFKFFDETLNAAGGTGEDWGQGGKQLAVAVAQDVVHLGPFEAIQRFGTMAPREASAFQACDGVLGLAFSPALDSASVLKSLFNTERPSWHVTQPKNRELMSPEVFAVLATSVGGELHLAGYDASAALGGKVDFVDMSTDSYSVQVASIKYGGHELLHMKTETGMPEQTDSAAATGLNIEGLFDTGSTCIELPDSVVGNLQASPFRALLDAHMRYGQHDLVFELYDSSGRTSNLKMPYATWTHPRGCLGPYSGNKIVFGDPIFRSYLVVHDMRPRPNRRFQLGIGELDPQYEVLSADSLPVSSDAGGGGKEGEEAHFDGGGWRITTGGVVKMGLTAVGHAPARRYLVRAAVGSPQQYLSLVLDTGSYLTQIYTCPPCRQAQRQPTKSKKEGGGSEATSASAQAAAKKNKKTKAAAAAAAAAASSGKSRVFAKNSIENEDKVSRSKPPPRQAPAVAAAKGAGGASGQEVDAHAKHLAHARRKQEAHRRLARKALLSSQKPPARQDRHRREGGKDEEDEKEDGSTSLKPSDTHTKRHSVKTGGFTVGAVFVLMALAAVLSFAEWKRRDEQQKHRFRLVDYRTNADGQPSHFDFEDVALTSVRTWR